MRLQKLKKVLYPVVFVALIALTIVMIVRESGTFTLQDFGDFIAQADLKWLLLAVLCAAAYVLCEGMALLVICDCLGFRRKFHRGIVYSAADIYFSAITPSATGGQPASALFMVQDGIPSMVTTAALLVNVALYTLSIVVITLGFGLACPDAFLAFETPSKVLILLGTVVQAGLFAGLLLLIFREHLLMKIIDFVYKILRRLHLARRSENRRAKLEEMGRDYHACARTLGRQKKKLFLAFLLNFVQRLSNMLVPALVYMASGGEARMLPRVLATQSMVVVGSNAVPIPGAVGVADILFFDGFRTITDDYVNLELLSRSLSFYISVLACALITLAAFLIRKKNGRNAQ